VALKLGIDDYFQSIVDGWYNSATIVMAAIANSQRFAPNHLLEHFANK
jgi:hypothetical protein